MDQYDNGKLTLHGQHEVRTLRRAVQRGLRAMPAARAEAYTEAEQEFLKQEEFILVQLHARLLSGDFKTIPND